jgi:hypothetical protein
MNQEEFKRSNGLWQHESTDPREVRERHRLANHEWYRRNREKVNAKRRADYLVKKGGRLSWNTGKEHAETPRAAYRPSVAALAWAAGFLEGEGCFTRRHCRVVAVQVNQRPLKLLQEWFGGSVYERHDHRPTRSICWHWAIFGSRARGVMLTLFPLVSQKRQQEILRSLHQK